MKLVSIFLLLSLASLTVFGFLAMEEKHSGCIAIAALARLQGIFCPGGESLAFVNFHFDFFKSVSNAFVIENIGIFAVAVLLIFLVVKINPSFNKIGILAFALIRQNNFRKFASERFFVRYLSFLENSPNIF